MCDDGMLDYRRVNEGRVLKATVGKEETTLGSALDRAAAALKGVKGERIAIVLSAQHSNEDNFALLKLARDVLGTTNVFMGGKPNGEGDKVLRHPDKNPNSRGVAMLAAGTPPRPMQDLTASVVMAEYSAILALGADTRDLADASSLKTSGATVVIATHQGPLAAQATVLLPASSWAESDGTYVNAKGIAQESEQAFGPLGDSRPAWKLLAGLALRLGQDFGWRKLADVRAAMQPEPGPASAKGGSTVGASS
jgi:NADH-quinone oxidoreductase subunit G